MTEPTPEFVSTTAGDIALHEYRLHVGAREWRVLHAGAILSEADEARFLGDRTQRVPYGVALWPASIALAHEVAARGDAFRGRRVLELGAGTGLPGIVAASAGGRVVQTDRHEVALHVCRRNGERNGVGGAVEHRLADWSDWRDADRYDWILGADVLYAPSLHADLRRIFTTNLAPGGRVLLADPFRSESMPPLEALEADGWRVTLNTWSVGEAPDSRPVGVYELAPPG